ncbi:MAG TPA: Asp-tRNA(Asn)/Glu-tRNA(Gln) amidotransferase subunit GatC [Balneolales bacterium]|nr:Asp-tRNA(Asn)/Glu-tRNA(Gln) amidotransferase subunit GatC [Balneolales bacterium]
MAVSKEEVAYIANLARLIFTDEEQEKLSGELSKILEYINQLNEVDTSDVPPLDHITELQTEFRVDKAGAPLDHEDALRNAPDADTDYFRVPKVIE